ncbi:MAG: methyltransferase, TIGR04325 family [Cyanobacteriota bacterium]
MIPSRLALKGPYPSYAAANAEATGYDSIAITEHVQTAVRALASGEIAYERDGTGYLHRPPELKIRKVLATNLGFDDVVVDFGGGLGGTFFNHADLFSAQTTKVVVEQPAFARAGRSLAKELGTDIYFYDSLSMLNKADIIIASSVLQYLVDYYEALSQMIALQPRLIIIDRTAFARKERWYIQECVGYGEKLARIPIRPIELDRLKLFLPGYVLSGSWANSFDPGWPMHRGHLFLRES